MNKVLLASIIIAILASFLASASPDGLEKVAEHLGFIGKAVERGSFMTDYQVSFIAQENFSTAIAGILGIFLVFSLFGGTALILKKRPKVSLK